MANKSTIKSDTKLLQFCKEILDEFLDEDYKFEADINSSNEKSYSIRPISGNWTQLSGAHGQSVQVVKLKSEFFLSCSICFKPVGLKLVFKSISLQFFDVRKLLFRAEWDNWEIKKDESSEDEDIKQHPQPHWHLGNSQEFGVTETVNDSFAEYIQNSSFKKFEEIQRERNKRDLNRLHFFMKWDENFPQPYYYDLTIESDFKIWLSETMRSAEQELSYLSQ